MKSKIRIVLKVLTIITSLFGVAIACALYLSDGYSAWYKRLYYFTNLSNLWICVVTFVSLFLEFDKSQKSLTRKRVVYLIQYIFTVSIALTGILYCGFLAHFVEDGYHPWSINSILSHVLTPVFAVAVFFLEDAEVKLTKRHALLGVIPPIVYFIVALVMGAFGVDFGHGQNYPYFFMDLNNPAGFFGFVYALPRPHIGTFYWLFICCLVILGLSLALVKLSRLKFKKK